MSRRSLQSTCLYTHYLPSHSACSMVWHGSHNPWMCIDMPPSPRTTAYIVSFLVMDILWVSTNEWWSIHHYSIIHSSFSVLRLLCAEFMKLTLKLQWGEVRTERPKMEGQERGHHFLSYLMQRSTKHPPARLPSLGTLKLDFWECLCALCPGTCTLFRQQIKIPSRICGDYHTGIRHKLDGFLMPPGYLQIED